MRTEFKKIKYNGRTRDYKAKISKIIPYKGKNTHFCTKKALNGYKNAVNYREVFPTFFDISLAIPVYLYYNIGVRFPVISFSGTFCVSLPRLLYGVQTY